MAFTGDAAPYPLCEFLLILPVAVEVEPVLGIKDQGPLLTRFTDHTASHELLPPFPCLRKNNTPPCLRSAKRHLHRKIKADVAFSRHPAHKRSGQNEFLGRSLGDLCHELRKVKIKRRKETTLL